MAASRRRLARAAPPRLALALALALCVSTTLFSSTPSLASPLAPRTAAVGDTSACESCLVFGHIVYDAVGDPYVESKLSEYLIGSICPNFDDKQSCEANVNNLVEALVEWMRANLEPEDLCQQAGLCAAAAAAAAAAAGPATLPPALVGLLSALAPLSSLSPAATTQNGPKDVTCPLCMFVLTKIKDALSDPITRAKVHDAGLEACASLPGGDAAKSIRDACVEFVERNEAEIYDFIDESEPSDLCERLKACATAPSVVLKGRLQTLLLLGGGIGGAWSSSSSSSSSFSSSSSSAAAALAQPLRSLSDGNCDACMAVVQDVHRAIASPDVQDQATALAKQACDALPSSSTSPGGASDLAGQCKAGVDQYAPLVFGMALAYLQPATLCAQVGLCPPPSAVAPAPAARLERGGGLLLAARGQRPQADEAAAGLGLAGLSAVVDALGAMVRGFEQEERRLERALGLQLVMVRGGDGDKEREEDKREEREEAATVAVAAS